MAVASSSTLFLGVLSSPKNPKFNETYLCKSKPFLLPLHPHSSPLTQSTLTFSVRKNNTNSAITSSSKKKKNNSSSSSINNKNKEKQSLPKKSNVDVEVVDDIDEDAIEALFNQLEEDLKSDGSFEDGDDDLTEEDLARLEKELKEAFGEDADLFEMLQLSGEDIQNSDDAEDDEEDEEEEEVDDDDDDDEEEESPVQLKNWQLRRLATALKIGRRKTSIKTLAAELCLDRALVLELLREPPPNLLMLSAALPDIVVSKPIEPEAKSTELSTETIVDVLEPSVEASDGVIKPDPKVRVPVHATQSRWSAQKRLKKVQTETLERVYLRSKRPTNAMISSIVHVTNLPKKRVVKWFEDKRAEDGIAEDRLPYQRSTAKTFCQLIL